MHPFLRQLQDETIEELDPIGASTAKEEALTTLQPPSTRTLERGRTI